MHEATNRKRGRESERERGRQYGTVGGGGGENEEIITISVKELKRKKTYIRVDSVLAKA